MDLTLRYLLIIRLLVIGGQLVALLAMDKAFGVAVPWLPVTAVLSVLAAFTVFSWGHASARGAGASQQQYLVQSVTDVLALSALIYFTGGSFNPFISLFLLPIVFAAAALSASFLAAITLLAIGAYTLLMFFHVPVDHGHGRAAGFDLHVWGMWYGFILSAACVTVFVARLSRRLRERDRALATVREEALRGEKLAALGALAAGTAHELGTPLSTIAILAGELEDLVAEDPEVQGQVKALQAQVGRCKEILSRMASDAGELQAQGGHRTDIASFLRATITDWRSKRPDVQVSVHVDGVQPPPEIIADHSVSQAIVNVLNNAADASSRELEVKGSWNHESFQLDVHDDGDGIADAVREQVGRVPLTTKPAGEGMGIGLFLARSVLLRLGGELDLSARDACGTSARIRVPLAPLTP